jgi:hypothetical protein
MGIMILRKVVLLAMALSIGGCATSFTGDPHIENGRSGCEAKCKGQGMALAGMVFMGEYTSGCVCTVPGQSASVGGRVFAAAQAGATAGSAGVVMQMRRAQQQQSQQNSMMMYH